MAVPHQRSSRNDKDQHGISKPRPKRSRLVASGLRRYPGELQRAILGRSGVASSPTPDWREIEDCTLAAVWLGHASVLLRLGGQWLVVDPVLSDRIGVRVFGRTIGPERSTKPALEASELPPIGTVLITHAHFDHLDVPTLRTLADERTSVVTATRTESLIPRGFGPICELGWGEKRALGSLRITALKPSHWGARRSLDRRRGYNAYVLDDGARRVLIAGDTAMTHAFDDLGPMDLAVFGIGAYDPWEHAHATPEQVWRMFTACGARALLPVHHSTFKLSDEPADEPLARLRQAAGEMDRLLVGCELGELWVADEDASE